MATTGHTADDNTCVLCHTPESSSALNAMIEHPHGGGTTAPCQACHGDSTEHAVGPTGTKPAVSFGPSGSSVDAQNAACLRCHGFGVLAHWQDGTHAPMNLGCVTCHDSHVVEDEVLTAAGQTAVCTQCHIVQRDGIHRLLPWLAANPRCAACHDSHSDAAPAPRMLANRSEGCRTCHDLRGMQSNALVSANAKSYHRVMQSADRTCSDCHAGAAHAAQVESVAE